MLLYLIATDKRSKVMSDDGSNSNSNSSDIDALDYQPVGEFPALGPKFIYFCEDCAVRWYKYGAWSSCVRHANTDSSSSTTVAVEFELRDVNSELVKMITGFDTENASSRKRKRKRKKQR